MCIRITWGACYTAAPELAGLGWGPRPCISNKLPGHGDAPDPDQALSSKAASLILNLILSFLKSRVSINTYTAHLHIYSVNLTLSSCGSVVSANVAAGYSFVLSFIHHCICRGRKCWLVSCLRMTVYCSGQNERN